MGGVIINLIHKIKRRLRLINKKKLVQLFLDNNGLEIGGPSLIFVEKLPIYPIAKNLDGCNFSTNTVWEGSIHEGLNYNYYHNKIGYQFISEASDLKKIDNDKYDFLLASHCLEHCANVLKTVKEWVRIIKPGGYLLLILPAKKYTFDHKRTVTHFEHLVADYENNIDETDLTHLDEILKLHDLSLDIPAGDLNNFKQRSIDNYNYRCLHHHVFDFKLLKRVFKYFKIKVKFKIFMEPYHQIILAQKR